MTSRTDERAQDVRLEAAVLVVVAVVATALFGFTRLDIDVAALFYHPGPNGPWPLASHLPWSLLYSLAPWITSALILGALARLGAALIRREAQWRYGAIFCLFSMLIGPGLLVNALLKEHWNRPRPRDLVEFGGSMSYVAAPLRGQGGSSFPSGHSSIGFQCGIGWWLWKRRRAHLARLSLGMGLISGTLIGLARMAAGAHFLSDVIWSALISFAVAHLLYYHVLRILTRKWQRPNAVPLPYPSHLPVSLATKAASGT